MVFQENFDYLHESFKKCFTLVRFNTTLAKRLLQLKERLRHLCSVCQAEMAAHTAKRLESVRPLCLIEFMPRKCKGSLFNRVCLESVKPLRFANVRAEHVWLFSSNIHA